jgi:signal transduction histidine kinase/CheY-like chemotaxis protein
MVMARLKAGDPIDPFETIRVRKGGETIDAYITISPIKDAEGNLQAASVIARDITERKRSECQLREMQKIESLGVIAGGVAHDFNNLLVGILGNASLVLESLAPSSPNYSMLRSVVDASERAAHLTRQLLAYAGKGRFVTAKVDLSALVTGIAGLIRSSIPKTVQLRFDLARELPAIDADPEQIQQLLMNLVINGVEAIGDGHDGTVSVTTKSQEVDEEYARQIFAAGAVRPGTYVSLRVDDTGCGMDAETTAKIFDPFFTTKFMGRGLGLSAVLGIVRGHRGAIRVSSAPAKGSSFEVLLPAAGGRLDLPPAELTRQRVAGSGTILVIDDEEVVRTTAKTALERCGYSVLLASDGPSGVDVFRDHAGEIVAVLLDMTMPVPGGVETSGLIRAVRPGVRVIVSSGYNEMEAARRFRAWGIAAFIKKPYSAAELAETVKHVLELEEPRDASSTTR